MSTAPTSPSSSTPTKQATLLDGLQTIRAADFTTFYQAPCARESLLTGIGAGFAVGGLRFVTLLGSRGQEAVQSPVTPRSSASAISRSPAVPRIATLSSRAWRSMTWAVLSFTIFSAGAHIYCQQRRKLERAAIARAADIVARKREEKRAEALRRREERESKRKEHEVQKGERSRWGRWFGSEKG